MDFVLLLLFVGLKRLGTLRFRVRRQAQDARHMNLKDSFAARRPRSLPTSAAACAWLVFRVTIFHAVFPSVVDMLKMLGILIGMDQKDSTSLVVFSAMDVQGWFAGFVAPRVVFH